MKKNSIVVAGFAAISVMPCMVSAESPYGARIVRCSIGGDAYDSAYTHPTNALGAPALFLDPYEYTSSWGEWTFSGVSGGVSTPVAPAYKEHEELFLTLDPGDDGVGTVTIEFDHDVLDDPLNPFGLDFIVFGNSFCYLSSGDESTPYTDPANCYLSSGDGSEEALVEVAQYENGPWYTSDQWRSADGFAPTLGRRYDPENADANLYSGNLWWGAKTDATFPVDPRIDFSDCTGLTLAELCQRYNGSAGGTGYDLKYAKDKDGNELPSDAAHGGNKWFRYVRISGMEFETPNEDGDYITMPEVDAVADVAPVSGYKNWVLDNFTWEEAWQTNLTATTVIAKNGLPNEVNCVYGLAPTYSVVGEVPQFKIMSFEPGETNVIKMLSPTKLETTPKGLVVKESTSLSAGWKSVIPTVDPYEAQRQDDGTWLNTLTVPKGDGAFFKLALDE